MFRLFHLALLTLTVVLGFIGISRLSYNVEILDLLPRGMPGVEGTVLFQEVYDRPDQLIVTVKGDTAVAADEAVEALVAALGKAPGLVRGVRYKPSWESHPEDMLELVAYSWLNAPPDKVKTLQASLSPSEIGKTLKQRLGRLASSMDPMAVAIESNDALGLTQAMRSGLDSATMEGLGGGGFANEDGTFRVLYLDAAKPMSGYRETSAWMDQIKAMVTAAVKPGVQIGYTGSPAFQAEIGTGMEGDMQQSVSGITFVVAFLFWLLHRRIKPLFFILLSMLATGFITLGVAGLMFGSLNVMSMGFAAILMGMIEDFGVLGLNDAMNNPGDPFKTIHRRMFPSIWWSAVTSAAVFGALGLSTLPGIAQMGILTGLGILIGAGVMLYGFLPVAMRLCKDLAHAPVAPVTGPVRWPGYVTLGLALLVAGVLGIGGLPGVANGSGVLRPKHCQSFEDLMAFEQQMKPEQDRVEWLPVVARGKDEASLASSLLKVDTELAKARQAGQILSHFLPTAFAPSPANQKASTALVAALLADRQRIFDAALSAGFNDRGLGLAKGVFDLWSKWSKAAPDLTGWADPLTKPRYNEAVRWPPLAKLEDSIGRQLAVVKGGVAAVGFVRMAKSPQVFDSPIITALQALPDVHVAGWSYLTSQLKTIMNREVLRVLLPAGVVLTVMFFFVFRGWRERVVAVGSIAFSGLILLAGMRLLHLEWNFVNIGTVPLCLGLGLDFNIHMIYSLRRAAQTGEDGHTIGRALAYCGLSTGLGFGALAMSDNVGLATFGVCSMIGVLATLFVAAYLVPWAWVLVKPGSR